MALICACFYMYMYSLYAHCILYLLLCLTGWSSIAMSPSSKIYLSPFTLTSLSNWGCQHSSRCPFSCQPFFQRRIVLWTVSVYLKQCTAHFQSACLWEWLCYGPCPLIWNSEWHNSNQHVSGNGCAMDRVRLSETVNGTLPISMSLGHWLCYGPCPLIGSTLFVMLIDGIVTWLKDSNMQRLTVQL